MNLVNPIMFLVTHLSWTNNGVDQALELPQRKSRQPPEGFVVNDLLGASVLGIRHALWISLHQFDLAGAPGLVEPRFKRAVEAQDHKPPFTR
jgi:hypothetical protein